MLIRLHRLSNTMSSDSQRSAGSFMKPGIWKKRVSEIVEIAMAMNPSGKRKYQASDILKSLGSGERIVYAVGNCGSP
jgi:hypothetical protein